MISSECLQPQNCQSEGTMEQQTQQFVTQFFSVATLAFAVGIYVIVLLVRKVLELGVKPLKDNIWWNEVALPAMPIVLAVVIALIAVKYPFPDIFAVSKSGRFIFGLVCGGFADLAYMKTKKAIGAFTSDTPAPAPLPAPAPPPPAPPTV